MFLNRIAWIHQRKKNAHFMVIKLLRLRKLLKQRQPTLGKKVGQLKKTAVTKGKLLSKKLAAKRKLRFSDHDASVQRRRSSLSAACQQVSKIAKGKT
jgi:hypothetical protein